MKYFNTYEEIYFNGERIFREYYGCGMDEKKCDHVEIFSGEKLIKGIKHFTYSKIFSEFSFTVNKNPFSKKYKIKFIDRFYIDCFSKTLHEDDIITYKRVDEEVTPSLKTILEYHDGEKAIQWLREKGIVLPM